MATTHTDSVSQHEPSSPVIGPGYNYGSITDKISVIVLTGTTPLSWFAGFLIAFALLQALQLAATGAHVAQEGARLQRGALLQRAGASGVRGCSARRGAGAQSGCAAQVQDAGGVRAAARTGRSSRGLTGSASSTSSFPWVAACTSRLKPRVKFS